MHGLDVRQRGMQAASDEETFDHRAQDARVVVSAETDFGTLLALRKLAAPSVILFRRGSQHRSVDQAELLKVNLPQLVGAVEAGSIAVIELDRIRIRALPLIPQSWSLPGYRSTPIAVALAARPS